MDSSAQGVTISPADENDRPEIRRLLVQLWGSTTIANRGVVHDASALPAILARGRDGIAGLATLSITGSDCELVTLNALEPGQGIGGVLLTAAASLARERGCRRLWLTTTNDNLDALRFYQRRGLRLSALHAGAVAIARRTKPSIPLVGSYGIPIRDELELELPLD